MEVATIISRKQAETSLALVKKALRVLPTQDPITSDALMGYSIQNLLQEAIVRLHRVSGISPMEDTEDKILVRLGYTDLMEMDLVHFCLTNDVLLDIKMFDIPSTMRRNVKKCAELGAKAVSVADHPLNVMGIEAAEEVGRALGVLVVPVQLREDIRLDGYRIVERGEIDE